MTKFSSQILLGAAVAALTIFAADAAFALDAPPAASSTDNPSHVHDTPGKADDAPEITGLTGDWGGLRTNLMNRGIDIQGAYTGDLLANTHGGLKRGTGYIDNLDLTMEVDGEKLYGLQGSKIFIYALNNRGRAFNATHVGSGEGVDNIEVATPSFKLYEAWVEQAFLDDQFSVRAGLYDYNSEFNVTDSSGVFLNPTYGIESAVAVTGRNSMSVFPTTSLGARVKWNPTENSYIQGVVLDGVPGDPNHPKGTHVELHDGDGVLLGAEAGIGTLETGRAALGGWWFSEKLDHLSDVDGNGDPLQRRSDGVYGVAEITLYTPDADGKRHLDGFVRGALTGGETSQFDASGSFGVSYTGMYSSRPDDVAGLAFHAAHNSDPYLRANPGSDNGEWGAEATYNAALTPWLSLQPDVQYIHNPGSTPSVDDALVTGLRMAISL